MVSGAGIWFPQYVSGNQPIYARFTKKAVFHLWFWAPNTMAQGYEVIILG
jgi:hypothetical protein